jgi:hypothetical protein
MVFKSGLWKVPLVVVLAGLVGCGEDCESLCQEAVEQECCQKECPDCECPDESACKKACRNDDEVVADSGCEDDYEAVIECTAEVDDICGAADMACSADISDGMVIERCGPIHDCASEREKLFACVSDYCRDGHLDEPACAFVPESVGPNSWW